MERRRGLTTLVLASGLLLSADKAHLDSDTQSISNVIKTSESSLITKHYNILVGAGDIARCDSDADEKTAALIKNIPGIVFTVGDSVYPKGTRQNFSQCYEPSWGAFKSRTKPAVGNHDMYPKRKNGAAYYEYFGSAAGERGKGYYSYDLAEGKWHVIVLNSNTPYKEGSDQDTWLRKDLSKHPKAHKIAIWHHPLFNAGYNGDNESILPLWKELYKHDTKIVINGHAHSYQRFAPQTPEGKAQPQGIREFIVGTGGGRLHTLPEPHKANLETSNNHTNGVLKLTLHDNSYEWEFKPVKGATYKDAGNQSIKY